MNIYEWARANKVDELAAHAIAYHFAGYKGEDNPFSPNGGFYRLGHTSMRDQYNPVAHQWNCWLFDNENTIAGSLDGLEVVDAEGLDGIADELNEQARISWEAMNANA